MRGEEILVAVKEHLHDGKNWIKGKYSGTTGEIVTSTSPGRRPTFVPTHDHCLMGAVQCVMTVVSTEEFDRLFNPIEVTLLETFSAYAPDRAERLREMNAETGLVSVEGMNDSSDTTWEDIDRVLDKAIARAGELGL